MKIDLGVKKTNLSYAYRNNERVVIFQFISRLQMCTTSNVVNIIKSVEEVSSLLYWKSITMN